jgi:Raf kinase inhibitor-like YbhB/YbcL family protein
MRRAPRASFEGKILPVITMKIESPAFSPGGPMPRQYARQGGNFSPPLLFHDVPRAAQNLVLIVDDPDAPHGLFTHWVVFNIDPNAGQIAENGAPATARYGKNSWGENRYGGPQPPDGEHRYFFRLYALDRVLDLPEGAERAAVEKAMVGHIVAEAHCMGRFAATEPAAAVR